VESDLLEGEASDVQTYKRDVRALFRDTDQFEYEILLVEMPELVSRSSLRSIRIARANLCSTWLTRIARRHAQEGRGPVDRVHDRLQQTPSFKLMR